MTFRKITVPLPTHYRRAFSLIELLAVMAIIALMLALLAPAISSFTSTAGRNGAVNILMNTMEQARVAALESGRTVYIVFHRRIFPEQDQILVLRDPDPDTGATNYDALTPWIKLPKGILLHCIDENKKIDILSEDIPTGVGNGLSFDAEKSPIPLNTKSEEKINILAFNAYGGVAFPFPNSAKLMLIISEGVRGNGATEALISTKKERAGGFEIITLRRYTGKASLEVSTL